MTNKCPFCGSFDTTLIVKKGEGANHQIKHTYYVKCLACHARGSAFSNPGKIDQNIKAKAERVWNEQ
jgi:translation initiation factor 2 beta subunit (eIF-2beta)/eIF-5